MSHVVVLGAGLGGTIMAYEVREKLRHEDSLTVVNLGTSFSFVPSNPWVAVGWRKRDDITVDLAATFKRLNIALKPEGAKKVYPKENRIELNDDTFVDYDYLIIATGPDLAFDEVPGLGPAGYTQSICHIDHATSRDGLPCVIRYMGHWFPRALRRFFCRHWVDASEQILIVYHLLSRLRRRTARCTSAVRSATSPRHFCSPLAYPPEFSLGVDDLFSQTNMLLLIN